MNPYDTVQMKTTFIFENFNHFAFPNLILSFSKYFLKIDGYGILLE